MALRQAESSSLALRGSRSIRRRGEDQNRDSPQSRTNSKVKSYFTPVRASAVWEQIAQSGNGIVGVMGISTASTNSSRACAYSSCANGMAVNLDPSLRSVATLTSACIPTASQLLHRERIARARSRVVHARNPSNVRPQRLPQLRRHASERVLREQPTCAARAPTVGLIEGPRQAILIAARRCEGTCVGWKMRRRPRRGHRPGRDPGPPVGECEPHG